MIPLNRLSIRDRRDAKETKANIPSVGEAKGFLSRIAVKCHLEISSSGNPLIVSTALPRRTSCVHALRVILDVEQNCRDHNGFGSSQQRRDRVDTEVSVDYESGPGIVD